MASNIRIKRSAVANKVPTTSDLSLGELAINFYDGKLFLKQDTSGVGVATTVIAVNPQALTTSSSPTFQNLTVVSQIGVGVTSYKGESGQFLKSTGTGLAWEALTASAPGSDTEVVFNNTGSLGASPNFTWNGTQLSIVGVTSTNNLNVSGVSTFTGTVSFGTSAYFGDNDTLYFGDGNDLQIYHTGTNSFISDAGTGNLGLLGDNEVWIGNTAASEYKARFFTNGAVELYYDNSKKFETTGYGATVFGILQSQGFLSTGIATISVNSSSDALRINQLGSGNALVVEDDTNPDATPFVVTASGSVGIGTTNPTSTLTVNGGIGATTLSVTGFSTFNYAVQFKTNADYIQIDSPNNRMLFRDSHSLFFGNGNDLELVHDGSTTRITNDGPLIIRNNSVSGVTSISGNTIGTIADFTQSGEVRIPGQLLVGSGGTVVTTTSSGSVGIGTTNPTSTLHVVGTSLVTGISTFSDTTDSASTTTGSLQTRGGLAVAKNIIVGVGISAAGIITCSDLNSTSDINLKTNIKPIQNPIEKILKIEGVNFDWKQDNRKSMGVVAQNIEEVLPELVSGGDTKTVNYNGLIGLLIEAIKDQQKQIDDLKDQINNK